LTLSFYYYVMKLQYVIYERSCSQSLVCRGSGFVQQITALDFYSAALHKNQ